MAPHFQGAKRQQQHPTCVPAPCREGGLPPDLLTFPTGRSCQEVQTDLGLQPQAFLLQGEWLIYGMQGPLRGPQGQEVKGFEVVTFALRAFTITLAAKDKEDKKVHQMLRTDV